jgi:hypothetical protein
MSIKKIAPRDIIIRIKLLYMVESDKELGEILGVKQNTVSGWKNMERGRKGVPAEYIDKACDDHNARRDWVLTGEGPIYRTDPAPAGQAPSRVVFPSRWYDDRLQGDHCGLLMKLCDILHAGGHYPEMATEWINSCHKMVLLEASGPGRAGPVTEMNARHQDRPPKRLAGGE